MDAYFALLKKWQAIVKPYSEEWAGKIEELYKKDTLSYNRAVELMNDVIEGKRGKTQKLKDARHIMAYSSNGVDNRMRLLNRYISEYEAGKIPEPLKKYAKPGKPTYYPIDEGAARRAKEMISFRDYESGRATREYRSQVDAAHKQVEAHKKQVDPDYHEKIDKMFDIYCKRLAEYINKDNSITASYPSVMISGAGGFNTRKKEKQNQRSAANYQWYKENVSGYLSKILSVGTGGISSDDKDAVGKLKKKLEQLEKSHEIMKQANAYVRKHKTLEGCPYLPEKDIKSITEFHTRMGWKGAQPFSGASLTNNLANIKRVKQRIAELEKRETTEYKGWKFDGGEVVFSKEDNRIRILYDGKPSVEVRDNLKHRGFRWAPSAGAWQRQITRDAIYAAEKVTGKR